MTPGVEVVVAFGLVVLGLLPKSVLLALLAGIVALAVAWGIRLAL